jgi:single-strand DNA-binding protein
MINKVILIGNLGRDPEIRRLENGAVVAKFSVATNENFRDKNGEWQTATEWHDIVMWRQLAERAESTLKKGMQIYLEGKLTHRTWQDQDGNNRKSTEIVANSFRLLGKREGANAGAEGGLPDDDFSANTGSYSGPESSDTDGSHHSEDDDLPF